MNERKREKLGVIRGNDLVVIVLHRLDTSFLLHTNFLSLGELFIDLIVQLNTDPSFI